MSLYIFLNEEAHEEVAKNLEGSSLAYRSACLRGINVRLDADGRLLYEVNNETGPMVSLVPIPLRKFVESISWQTHLPPDSPTQTLGRYVYESAEAIVDHRRDRQGWRTARISGPVIEEVYQLYFQLRAGQATLIEAWQETEEPLPPVKFACASCGAKYTIAGEKVIGRTVKYRCRKCGVTIEFSGEGTVPAQEDKKPTGQLHLVKKDPDKNN